jgi:hypothetical protein
MRRLKLKVRKFLAHNILHADDSSHRIALGVGLATFVAILPIIGLQTIIALALAALFRANKAVCIPTVWITNPVTVLPIYAGCLALGRYILGIGAAPPPVVTDLAAIEAHFEWVDLLSLSTWWNLLNYSFELGLDLWVGCLIVAVVLSVPAYFLSKWAVDASRRHHQLAIARRRERLAEAKHARNDTTTKAA